MAAKARVAVLATTLLGASWVGTAQAHHSFAAYDMVHSLTAPATIKEFRWGAPHSSIVLVTRSPEGKARELTLITASPNMFVRQGFNPKSFRAGDKVVATYHPNINGSAGGALASVKFADGRIFKDQEAFGATPPPSSPSPR